MFGGAYTWRLFLEFYVIINIIIFMRSNIKGCTAVSVLFYITIITWFTPQLHKIKTIHAATLLQGIFIKQGCH